MSTDTHLHVIFGTGPLGRAIMHELVKRGARVRMVNRRGQMAETPTGVEIVRGDAYAASAVRDLTRGASVVYQCAQPEYHEWPEKFPPLQAAIIEGLAANKNGVAPKLIIAENMYMYGDTHGQPLHEAVPHAAHTRKGRVRAEMSAAALAAHRAGQVRVAIGRGSDFFGPYAFGSSLGDRVFYPALVGKAAQMGGRLDVPHTYTYTADFGKALVILGEHAEALGQAWHVPNDQPTITQRQMATLIYEAVGQPTKVSAVSKGMMQLAGLFIPGAREMVEMMYEFEQPFIVDSSKFDRAFGMKPTPVREAVAQTVAWYQAHPEQKH